MELLNIIKRNVAFIKQARKFTIGMDYIIDSLYAASSSIEAKLSVCKDIANAIINAPRTQMLGATLYMACVSPVDGHLFDGTSSCMMCKKMIINAGIDQVVIRDNGTDYRVVKVSEWIEDDDSLSGKFGY